MAKSLEMTFLTDSGKLAKLTIDIPKEPIDPVAVKAAMDYIISSDALIASDGSSPTSAKSAKLIDRNVIEYELA